MYGLPSVVAPLLVPAEGNRHASVGRTTCRWPTGCRVRQRYFL